MPAIRFQPSGRMIAGIALALFAFTLVGVGLYHLLQGGSCSTTGYGRYGPLPKCPAGTGWWVAFVTAGIFIGIGGALLAGSAVFVIPGLFTAIGLAAILFALGNADEQGAVLFGLIFGGSFLIGGLAVPVVGGIRWLRTQRAP
jgi:hypothetical protein